MEWQSTHASSVAPLRAKTALPDSFGFKETHDFNVILLFVLRKNSWYTSPQTINA